MTEKKEANYFGSCEENYPQMSSRTSRSNSSESNDMTASSPQRNHLHLQLPSCSNSASSHSCPSPQTAYSGEREGSTGSTFSSEPISYRDLSDIQDEFKIIKVLHNGTFSKTILARQQESNLSGEMANPKKQGQPTKKYFVLKAFPSGGLFTDDFKRELRYNYFLSPHPNIVTSYNISFNWASSYNVYVQEHAPFGDLAKFLTTNSSRKCLPDGQVKLLASQLASGMEFMHSFKLVHQDIRAENVLIFKLNFSQVKLCDFGVTRREGAIISKGILSQSNSLPPELNYLLPQEKYECHRSTDVWQLGILLCFCLTGSLPWAQADFADPVFRQYTNWLKRKSLKLPEPFKKFSPRLIRLLKRLLEPKIQFRAEIREIFKYLGDEWMKSNHGRKNNSEVIKRKSSAKREELRNILNLRSNVGAMLKIEVKSTSQEKQESVKKNVGEMEGESEENVTNRVEQWIAKSSSGESKIDCSNF